MSLDGPTKGTWTITASRPVHYEVRQIDDALHGTFPIPAEGSPERDILGRTPGGSVRRLVVIDRNVLRLYGEPIRAFLARHEIEWRMCVLPGGERTKRLRNVVKLWKAMDRFGLDRRREPLLVWGGGASTDTAGLAASVYRRDLPRIEFPTTLVGMVDASLGVKRPIDFNGYKNRLCGLSAPDVVIADRRMLRTVSARSLNDGAAEVLKVAVVLDAELFARLEIDGPTVLAEKFQGITPAGERAALAILGGGIGGQLGDLHDNLFEEWLYKKTFGGHTVSPAIEMEALRRARSWLPWRRRGVLLHGEAVALDLALSVVIAMHRGLLSPEDCERVLVLEERLGLPVSDSLFEDGALLARGLAETVRHRDGKQRWPLPDAIGSVTYADDVGPHEMSRATRYLRERPRHGAARRAA